MRLDGLRVEKFKAVGTVEIPLGHVNVLVGGNGSGKSSMLQAVHLACCVMRQASRIELQKTTTVGVEELDYLPTEDYKTLGHLDDWGKNQDSAYSQVTLFFADPASTVLSSLEAMCRLRSARNAGISATGDIQSSLVSSLRTKNKFFSAYIPGISGIPNREERKSKKVVLKACSFGDSNVILRNALLLLKEQNAASISQIETWIGQILGPIKIHVEHNNDVDLYIKCSVTLNGQTKPIELTGTGYIQLIQIFCYILLFSPGILLIDEPDIHLHPNVQERLVRELIKVARERSMRIVLSTHSPFIVRGAPSDAKIFWLDVGKVESTNRDLVELALGWGAFGKRIILVSEDSKNELLKAIIRQWPELDRAIGFCPGTGYKGIPSPSQARDLVTSLGNSFKIMIHRDRDSLTDDEVATLKAEYQAAGVELWFPAESDVEAYFCQVPFLEIFLACPQATAQGYVDAALHGVAAVVQQQFASQRAAHNEELHKEGGSPTNDFVWNTFQARPLRGAKGKTVFKRLQNTVPANAFRTPEISSANLGGAIGLDLKHAIEMFLAA